MQHAERAVAVFFRTDDGAESEDVGELLEIDLLVFQLAPDRIGTLGTALNPRLDPGFGQLAFDLIGDAGDALR